MSAAKKRMEKFARYIKQCKEVPKPPKSCSPLNDPSNGIDVMLYTDGGLVECEVGTCTDEEKRFLLEVARKLGFKPKC